MKQEKPKLLIIVEGINDSTALTPLSTLYHPRHFSIITTYGDITSQKDSVRSQIKSRLYSHIKQYMDKYGLTRKDIIKVWFITDTDGTFIPEENLKQQPSCEHFIYESDKILCKDRSQALLRNQRKKSNLLELLKTKKINKIPLELYFMSCNFDHVICGKANCSPEEKGEAAEEFQIAYGDATARPKFEKFFLDRLTDIDVPLDYTESWDFIQQNINSLQRCSNFYLALKTLDDELTPAKL
ncbi:MAG TPA: hypothetical protein IAB18_00570 [Candidatus Avisuccinivibrio pullicola]|nr:hypothetical protein [Candidatus Avisuccinivibrio pullicola]